MPGCHLCSEEDRVHNSGFSQCALPGSQGFFYTRYPYHDRTSFVQRGSNNSAVKYPQLYYHTVGTKQAQDYRLLAFPGHPTWAASVKYTDDNK